MRACGSIVISGLENCKLDFEKEIKVNPELFMSK